MRSNLDGITNYSISIHKSLMQPDLILGIPKQILILIACITMCLVYLIGFVFIFAGLVMYIPCYLISKDDPLTLIILLESLFEPDRMEG